MKVVGIGGGHGLAATLRAARLYADDIAAVVTVADDGGSSGQLSRELSIPPPGDIRNCLVALSGDDELARLYQHRFTSGPLTGHTVGNLVIAALADMTGDFAQAVADAGRVVKATGEVYPATTELVSLRAQVEGGVLRGQVAVAQTKRPIQTVQLEPPDPPAHRPAVDAILSADQVVLGPGSLFTSLIATLLVPGIAAAVRQTAAHRVFVCNARTQKGETEGLDCKGHLRALLQQAGACADTVVVQVPELSSDGVRVDRAALAGSGLRAIGADVATDTGQHVPERLAQVLTSL